MSEHRLQDPEDLAPEAAAFYRGVMQALSEANLQYLVGGGFALLSHTGISRCTKDLDLFVLPSEVEQVLPELSERGYETELTYPHWLGKVKCGEDVVDIIFSSGNGLCPVDEQWFAYAKPASLLGMPVLCAPVEEMIWQKSFIMERHRYDGADIIHLLHCCGGTLDWKRLASRFQENWKLLLAHLVMASFVYPNKQCAEAARTTEELASRMIAESREASADLSRSHEHPPRPICHGTLLSLLEYLPAVHAWGYRDARLPPTGVMTAQQIDDWTATFEK